LLELDFLPVAYVPAMVFHDVERLDAIRMVRLLTPLDVGEPDLLEGSRAIFGLVMRNFASKRVQPRLAQAAPQVPQFVGLNDEQIARIAGLCVLETYPPGDTIIREGTADNKVHFILAGTTEVTFGPLGNRVGTLGTGHCLGESTLLRPGDKRVPHSATATAKTHVETAVLRKQDVEELIRRRPDIGVVLFRNLAVGITDKLHSLDEYLTG
jgi:CRP-like cAMP-binding protein